jgi:hypothetical protein
MIDPLTCDALRASNLEWNTAASLPGLPFLLHGRALDTRIQYKLPNTAVGTDGVLKRGRVRVGDAVELVGGGRGRVALTVTGIGSMDAFGWRAVNEVVADPQRRICVLFDGVSKQDTVDANAVAAPGTVAPQSRITCILTADRAAQLASGARVFLGIMARHSWTYVDSMVWGTVIAPQGAASVQPGSHTTVQLDLERACGLELADRVGFATPEAIFDGVIVSFAPQHRDLSGGFAACFAEAHVVGDVDRRQGALVREAADWWGIPDVPNPPR